MVERLKPWLWLSPQVAHKWGPLFLNTYGRFKPLQTLTWSPFAWRDLEFTNPLGIAGGVDKNAECIDGWWTLGAGFIEVGTVTPRPQDGNGGKILDRDKRAHAVWNKMGFPNRGAEFVARQLKGLYQPHFTPIFVNIGKNRETKLEAAHEDYIACMKALGDSADAFVINISSPNTEGLRELLQPENLQRFLEPLVKASHENLGSRSSDQPVPLLLKVSPDITNEELKKVLDISLNLNIDGWILTNTSIGMREGLRFPSDGGVSGLPLAKRSKELLTHTIDYLGERRKGKLIVSSGGVMSPTDVFERLRMGANLVQVYSALVFNGPFFFRQVADQADLSPGLKG